MKTCLPPQWISGQVFENWLNACDPHQCRDAHIEIHVPTECKILIQSALMMVSLLNQLASTGRHVILTFDAVGETYNYLNRMGVFDCLNGAVDVRPERPLVSGAAIYGGGNPRLVEIHALPPGNSQAVQGLPTLLASSLRHSLHGQPTADTIEAHLSTVLTEVLDNVYEHSDTVIPGLVALQPYLNAVRPYVVLAISDSGYGIPHTLRTSVQGIVGRSAGINR